MEFSAAIIRRVEEAFARNMSLYPEMRAQVAQYCEHLPAARRVCLQFLYSCIHVNDLVSYPISLYDSYARASLAAREALNFDVPEELFLTYVLPARINNENLDASRAALLQELLPRVANKSMTDAALEVNYWCYEHGTYISTDDRTVCPNTFRKAALGRCGEESVFLVSALRAVGLPARQVYVPRWSHCDDNHAWVEVWADGTWYYLGACEPEPMLNKGWFTAAASRAMLVAARSDGCLLTEGVTAQMPLRALANATATYGPSRTLRVYVTQDGAPVAGAEVLFELVNFSELFPIHAAKTDESGCVCLLLGCGDLMVQLWHAGRFLLKKVDLRKTDEVHLEVNDGCAVEALDGLSETFCLVPPAEQPVPPLAAAERSAHEARLRLCEQTRGAFTASFDDGALSAACANEGEIAAFLDSPEFPLAEKQAILATLRPKDLLDASKEMLCDALAIAREYRDCFDEALYTNYILCPRISDEMLLPHRRAVRAIYPQGFSSGAEILQTLRHELRIQPEYGMTNFFASVAGSLTHKMTSAHSFGVVFVAVCRCFGIPARRNPLTGGYEWYERGTWLPIDAPEVGTPQRHFTLTLRADSPLRYEEQFTVGRFEGDRFVSLGVEEEMLDGALTLSLPGGMYRVMTNTRQIDGSCSVRMQYLHLRRDCELVLHPQPERTRDCLHAIALDFLPEGSAKQFLRETCGRQRVLIWAQPGKEPTEHLLRELLQAGDTFDGICVGILLAPGAEESNATLQKLLRQPWATLLAPDEAALPPLRRALGVGDERLPFAAAVSRRNSGLFAFANYNIRTAQRLLSILRISEEDNL